MWPQHPEFFHPYSAHLQTGTRKSLSTPMSPTTSNYIHPLVSLSLHQQHVVHSELCARVTSSLFPCSSLQARSEEATWNQEKVPILRHMSHGHMTHDHDIRHWSHCLSFSDSCMWKMVAGTAFQLPHPLRLSTCQNHNASLQICSRRKPSNKRS